MFDDVIHAETLFCIDNSASRTVECQVVHTTFVNIILIFMNREKQEIRVALQARTIHTQIKSPPLLELCSKFFGSAAFLQKVINGGDFFCVYTC